VGSTVQIEDVSKEFREPGSKDTFLALEEISFRVEEGEFVCVVGPSGCGKTTLLNIVAGLLPSTTGTVKIDERVVTKPTPRVGVVFQDYALFPWMTVKQNLEFGPKALRMPKAKRDKVINELIDLVGLQEAQSRYPHQLSGGMQQRCALARTLATNPDVLLMDEPLGALDAQTRRILQGELLRIWGEHLDAAERRTVLFVTHAIDEAAFLSDRVVVMSRLPGRVKAVLDNPIERPREHAREHQDFLDFANEIWSLIEHEAKEASEA
jgi:NitT/TauT family transport system ATP-binding protein